MKDKKKLAVAVLAYNEERDLPGCLDSLADIDCDVYVFDSNSTDETPNITYNKGCRLVNFDWNGRYPKKKQWILNYLSTNYTWVLMLDADERVPPSLSCEILKKLEIFNEVVAYDVTLEYWFQSKQLKHGLKVQKRLLVQPEYVEYPEIDDLEVTNMWEVEGHYQPIVNSGQIENMKASLIHNDSDGLFSYISRHNRYSDWEAYVLSHPEVMRQVLENRPMKAKIMSKLPAKGLLVFFYCYIFKRGFLDGRNGLDFAIHQSFYYWQIQAKRRAIARNV